MSNRTEMKIWSGVNRVEVIDHTGRVYVRWQDGIKVMTSLQDDAKTLKVFIESPAGGARAQDDALEALKSAYEDLHRANPMCVRLAWYRNVIAKAEAA